MATVSFAVAEIIPFNLDKGLSPIDSSIAGSGGEIEPGIWYDTETQTLSIVLGYGSSVAFKDLTGPATGIRVYGPQGGNTAAELFDLWPQHFPNVDAAKGGIIRGAVVFKPEQVDDLFNGKDFVNVQTEKFPDGEICGYLIPVLNQAPVLACPADITQECKGPRGNEIELTLKASDPEGDAFTVVWSVDGEAVLTNDVPAGAAGAAVELSYADRFTLGQHVVLVKAADAKNTAECQTKVTIVDTTPPVIRRITTEPRVLWPPNHRLVRVRVHPEVRDCSPTTWKIVSVTSNEPEDDKGDGKTSPDWVITGDQGLQLRAERSGKGKGRVYTITIAVTDAGGLKTEGTAQVRVPHDLGRW